MCSQPFAASAVLKDSFFAGKAETSTTESWSEASWPGLPSDQGIPEVAPAAPPVPPLQTASARQGVSMKSAGEDASGPGEEDALDAVRRNT